MVLDEEMREDVGGYAEGSGMVYSVYGKKKVIIVCYMI